MPADVSSLDHKQGDMINTVQSPRPPAIQHSNSTLSFRQIKIPHIRKVNKEKHEKKHINVLNRLINHTRPLHVHNFCKLEASYAEI